MAAIPNPADNVAVDVLIVGAGPAGFMAALTLARYGVSIRLIDSRPNRIQTGHAGGMQPRTQEILHTLNLLHTLNTTGYRCTEMAFWAPSPSGTIQRTHVSREIKLATPYPWLTAGKQRETEAAFDNALLALGHTTDRPTELTSFSYTDDPVYPVHARVKNHYSHVTSTYRCKYILGADGAGSKTRKLLGLQSESHGGDDFWCTADVKLSTDFPDIRRRTAIRTATGGLMIIPQADGANRFYTQLSPKELGIVSGDVDAVERGDNAKVSSKIDEEALEKLLRERVKEVLGPYSVEITNVFWISQYWIRQRVVEDFWDHKRVLLLGDACHTHSPKSAQGLNVSMQDAYNLTWKLALTLKNLALPSLLPTYALERRAVALELIYFDKKFAHLFGNKDYLDNKSFHEVYETQQGFTSGIGILYKEDLLTKNDEKGVIDRRNGVLEPLIPGRRIYTARLRRCVDGQDVDVYEEMPSNGRFHIFVFAGDAISEGRLKPLTDYLAGPESALTAFNEKGIEVCEEYGYETIHKPMHVKNRGKTVDLFFICTENHMELEVGKLPKPLPDWRWRIFADPEGREHRDHGVDVKKGFIALVRPDLHVGMVCGLDEGAKVTEYLKGFLTPQHW